MVVTGRGCKEQGNIEPEAILKPTDGGYEIIKSSNYLKKFL